MPLPPHVQRRRIRLPVSGVEIALLDWGGKGPLALLHHANGFCGALWALVAESLERSFRVVAMDARGHGDSSRPEGEGAYAWDRFPEDLLGVARALAPEAPGSRIALGLGHSFGGTSTLAAAARAPGLFERVLAVDPVVFPPGMLRARRATRTGNARAKAALRRRAVFESRDAARSRWQGRDFFAEWDPRALELYVQEGLRERPDGQFELKCPPEVEAAIFSAGSAFDLFELAPGIDVPARILWAAGGNFPREVHESLAACMAKGSVEPIEAGHLAPMERPDLVVEAVQRFVREVSGGRPR